MLALGVAFNWSWLVAAGAAPLLLSVLPCGAMCALGPCVNRMAGFQDKATSAVGPETETDTSVSLAPPRALLLRATRCRCR